ncbi:helix-turn-helix domain-containing protein [Promicromonospora iranensis]|uniref:Excisionase family DNA binding protein n=1 Tax=Promicromonospora iranensis TaxID=1105144 RepID=A0ABU2CQ86_9MICO|nr:helix-turn-helix domain-containing protein [Promicromonospora iranensis]MDR7383508.1 excisionase family DNA binding protein [Promicromonospora iranensis]
MATATTAPVYSEARPTVTVLLYRVEEAAEALCISRTQVFDLIRLNKLTSVKIGRARRIPVSAVNEYVTTAIAEAQEAT